MYIEKVNNLLKTIRSQSNKQIANQDVNAYFNYFHTIQNFIQKKS